MNSRIKFLVLSIFLSSNLSAQVTFQKVFGMGVGWDVDHTSDGGFIITGRSFNEVTTNQDLILIKTDLNGDTSCEPVLVPEIKSNFLCHPDEFSIQETDVYGILLKCIFS